MFCYIIGTMVVVYLDSSDNCKDGTVDGTIVMIDIGNCDDGDVNK